MPASVKSSSQPEVTSPLKAEELRERIRSRLEEGLCGVELLLETRFPHMAGRGDRVARIARAVGRWLGAARINDYALWVAARFHDLGMLAVPEGVLLKREALSPAELTAIRRHPALGARVASSFFPDLPAALAAIVYHHERPDGAGIYGLRADKIPTEAAIIAVAGAVEAMAQDRPHRAALAPERIIEEVKLGRDRQFVSEVVDVVLAHATELLAVAGGAAPPSLTADVPKVEIPSVQQPQDAAPSQGTVSIPAAVETPAVVEKQAAVSRPPAMTREQAFQRLEEAMAGRALSPVAARVVSLTSSADSEVQDLAGVIATDPVLAARVLDVANSAAYRANRRLTTSISEAIRNIGLSTIRNIALALGIFDAVPSLGGRGEMEAEFKPIRYWQHSLAVARLCEELVAKVQPGASGIAYLAGLCHELGVMVFRSQFAAELRYLEDERSRGSESLETLERKLLGTTRGELESGVFDLLHLPGEVAEAVRTANRRSAPGARDGVVAQALACADYMATGLLLAPAPDAPVRPLIPRMLPATSSSASPAAHPARDSFAAEILALTATLARLSGDEEAELARPLFRRRSTKVWLARSAEYSSYDPIAAALGSLCDLTISDRLPSADELRIGVDRLVIVTSGRAGDPLVSASHAAVKTLLLMEPNRLGKVEQIKPAETVEVESCLIPISRLVSFLE